MSNVYADKNEPILGCAATFLGWGLLVLFLSVYGLTGWPANFQSLSYTEKAVVVFGWFVISPAAIFNFLHCFLLGGGDRRGCLSMTIAAVLMALLYGICILFGWPSWFLGLHLLGKTTLILPTWFVFSSIIDPIVKAVVSESKN